MDVSATTGAPATNVPVATFSVDDANAQPGDFSASIDWGDGTSIQAGTISGSNGNFTVTGTQTFLHDNWFTATVSITHGTATDSVTGLVTVADAPLSISTVNLTAAEGVKLQNVNVATFTDSDPNANSAMFS